MLQSFRVDLAPDENGHVFLVFDTVIDSKHCFTACGIGRIERGQPFLTPVGQATMNALAGHTQDHRDRQFHFVEIATVAAAPIRVLKALKTAHEKDAVFFLCRRDKVYDAAVQALNVRFDPAGTVQ